MTTTSEKIVKALGAPLRELDDEGRDLLSRCLLALYGEQTEDERAVHTTAHLNGRGFNALDAPILSDLAVFLLKTGRLSEKQLALVQRKLRKYRGQLMGLSRVVEGIRVPTQGSARRAAERPRQEREAALNGDGLLMIRFQYSRDLVQWVKREVPGRRWNPEKRCWTAPATPEVVRLLKDAGFRLDQACEQILEEADRALEIPGLKRTLYPFQEEGVRFLESREGRGLIGDEMGLGKTVQALAWLTLHPEARPVVIVCPASVKLNWAREIEQTLANPGRVLVASGREPTEDLKTDLTMDSVDIVIINYDVLAGWAETLREAKPSVLILDESHFIKNPKAKRTKAVRLLAKGIPHLIALSGTPIVNRPVEFFTVLNLLDPRTFPSFWRYAQEYCGARHNGFGWDFSGASNLDKLHNIVSRTIMIRRKKADVLRDLPPKVRSVVPVEIDHRARRAYEARLREVQEWIEEHGDEDLQGAGRAEALVRIEWAKQATLEGKLPAVVRWLEEYLETEDKVVVYATHHRAIDHLKEALSSYHPVVLDGRTPPAKRQEVVDTFQTDPTCRVFLGNVKAAGVGITLTAASATVTVELGWTPGEHDQAEDRVHRIGQEADSVRAYYLVAADTIEEEIAALLDRKRQVLSQTLDGKPVDREQDLLVELIWKMKERSNK